MEFQGQVSVDAAHEALSKLKTEAGRTMEDAKVARIFVTEVMLSKALRRWQLGHNDGVQDEKDKVLQVIQSQFAWLASNDCGLAESELNVKLVERAKSFLK